MSICTVNILYLTGPQQYQILRNERSIINYSIAKYPDEEGEKAAEGMYKPANLQPTQLSGSH